MNKHRLVDYINRYVNLLPEEETFLLSKTRFRKYLKGQYIVQQGDICDFENFVLSGCLKTSFLNEDGQEHIVMFALEEWWAGDLGSFIDRTPASYNIQCLENSEVIQFTMEDLELLYEKIPKLERFFRIIIQRAYIASEKRLIRNFSLPAKERYLLFRDEYPQIEGRVPQYMIASYLGITKEFLSKIRKEIYLRS